MLPRLATLAPLAAALAILATAAEAAPAGTALAAPLPDCSRHSAENATAIEVFCFVDKQFRVRISHKPAALIEHSRLVVVCEPHRALKTDYEALYAMNLQLGETYNVLLHQCPLPAGPLRHFLERLGVYGVQFVRVRSLSLLNDTMPADFLEGIDLETLRLDGLTRIKLHDDFLASTSGLHNLTITSTNTSLPEGLLRHTPQLRKLHLLNLNAGRLPTTFLHGLHNLTKLLAARNGLRELTREHFRDLGNLRYLDLYKNELETLPGDVFSSLGKLEVMRIECNPFHALPETLFAGTPRLEMLRVNGQLNANGDVPSLPATIFHGLTRLKLLMLDRLGLHRLPPGLFRGLTALRNLTLDHNELTELPVGIFSELSGLLNLDLSRNQLHQIPQALLRGLESMDTIYLNGNGLIELPSEMFANTPRLQRLFLQDNNLTTLEELTFSGLDLSLQHLDLSNNSLQLGRQESAFSSIREVRNLNLRRNRVQGIPEEIRFNLLKLERLDLSHNELQVLNMADVNFITSGAEISMMYNNITQIQVRWLLTKKDEPNKIYVGKNPLVCDCYAEPLHYSVNRTRTPRQEGEPGPQFLMKTEGLQCAGPPALAGHTFGELSADQLVCPWDDCPAGCNCTLQPSQRTVITSCSRLPSSTPALRPNYTVSLRVERADLRHLENVSWSEGEVTSLYLSRNFISELTPALLPTGLRELRLDHNNMSRVGEPFLEWLDTAPNNRTRLWLSGNPFVCDCELLPLHQYLQLHVSGQSLRIMDASQMTCVGGDQSSLLELTSEQLCPSRTATIVAVCVVASAVAVCLLVVLCVYYRHGEMLKVWLYSHNLCLWFVTEEELDTDKKYDAFISYSHLDEQFVAEQLVPELERGEPRYELCLHFRDWLAGEWITDQIQRSVQDSRRVIVVMSNNFIQSEWGRLEFLTAHKQALEDKRNRVVVIVYGDLPDPDAMDPELRLYISMNTYLKWDDAHFWQRLRYALPHKGHRLKRGKGRQNEKFGMVSLGNGTGLPTPVNGVTVNGVGPPTPVNGVGPPTPANGVGPPTPANGVALPPENALHTDANVSAPATSKLGNGDVHPVADQVV